MMTSVMAGATPQAEAAAVKVAAAQQTGTGHRAVHVDCAKGLGIALIAFWHSSLRPQYTLLPTLLQLVVVPLFVLAAGAFFKPADRGATTLLRRLDVLLRPYVTVGLFAAALTALRQQAPFWDSIGGVLWATGPALPIGWSPLWFLPTLALTYVAARLLFRLAPAMAERLTESVPALVICVTLFAWIGCRPQTLLWPQAAVPSPSLFWNLNLLPLFLSLFLLGRAARPLLLSPDIQLGRLFVSSGVFLACSLLALPELDMNRRIWTPLFPATIGCLVGCYAIYRLSAVLAQVRPIARVLERFGRDSLYILCFHLYVGSSLGWQLRKLAWFTGPVGDQAAGWLSFALSLLVPCLIAEGVRRIDWLRACFEPRRTWAQRVKG